MNPFTFKLRTHVHYGPGTRHQLADLLKQRGFTRVGMVIDQALPELPMYQAWLEALRDQLDALHLLVYDQPFEPTYGYLDQVKDFFREREVDVLVGVGGGSVMDTTKGLAVLTTNPVERAVELRGFPTGIHPPVPVVMVPTVSGTGSEVTYFAVFTDEDENRKFGINTEANFPVFALLDPELATTAPRQASFSSALDGLVHALESFMSVRHTPFTRPWSMAAVGHLTRGLRGLQSDLRDLTARGELMHGSYLAGAALMNASAGPAGALSYPLGVFYHIPHGLAGAFFLQHILPYNLKRGYTDFADLAPYVLPEPWPVDRAERAAAVVDALQALIREAGIPKRLRAWDIPQEDLGRIADHAIAYLWPAFEMNPVPMSQQDARDWLASLW
ncbi:MAG: iron-containing alcohol dehydrogenase [Chloroflexi bacterium]|nr:iron-containing alcohol dehydrogenase [Chloroflexota bacterium]